MVLDGEFAAFQRPHFRFFDEHLVLEKQKHECRTNYDFFYDRMRLDYLLVRVFVGNVNEAFKD